MRLRFTALDRMILLQIAFCIVLPSSLAVAAQPLPSAIQNVFRLGGAYTVPTIGVDLAGNMYVAGGFSGAVPWQGFPVAGMTVLGATGGYPGFFVAKISPSGDRLLHLTEINDSNAEYDHFGGMVVEPDGSVVLAGGTQAPDFPTTAGSYQPHASNGGAFLLKLDASGEGLVFSTFLDDSSGTTAYSVAVGPDGSFYLGGYTNGRAFPTTPGAYQQSLPASATGGVGFVSKISADGAKLLLSTLFVDRVVSRIGVDGGGAIHFVGLSSTSSTGQQTSPLVALDASFSHLTFETLITGSLLLQVDAKGDSYVVTNSSLTEYDASGAIVRENQIPGIARDFTVLDDGTVVLVGGTSAVNFPTRNTLLPCNMNLPHDTVPVQWWVQSAALLVLDSQGTVLNASFLGGGAPAGYGNDSNGINSIARDQGGLLHMAGYTSSLNFPTSTDLILGIPDNSSNFGMTLDLNALPKGQQPSPACLAFSAPFGPVEAPAVPAMPMTVFGGGLGPITGISTDPSLPLPTQLSGVSVTVGGLRAIVLYVQDQQINFLVPQNIAGPETTICVNRGGMQGCLYAYVGNADGAWLPGVLNEDGTVNSATNPAAIGSVVSFFGIGFGVFDPTVPDGMLTSQPLPSSGYSVQTIFQSADSTCGFCPPYYFPGTVEYFGTAPGLLNGAVQLNVKMPSQAPGWPTLFMYGSVMETVPEYPLRAPPVVVHVK